MPGPQAEHRGAFEFSLNVPGAHALHRSSATLLGSASYSPGMHGVLMLQYDCPDAVWYLPAGQLVQCLAFVLFENLFTLQSAQARSDVTVSCFDTYCPEVQTTDHGKHTALPLSLWKRPGSHSSHSFDAVLLDERWPMSHSSHETWLSWF